MKAFVVITATDGNHGRALAAAARSTGCRCVVVLHAQVRAEREAPIAALGDEIVRIAGNYDESVQEAARLAEVNGWQVVSDTSYDGYEDIPRDVMQGYGIIVDELLETAPMGGPCSYTHVVRPGCWRRESRLGAVQRGAPDLHRRGGRAGRLPAAKRSPGPAFAGIGLGRLGHGGSGVWKRLAARSALPAAEHL